MITETRYARTADGVRLAYQVLGLGPVDLVLIKGFVAHLEVDWEEPRVARFFRRRMGVLVGIGLLHMYGLWAGDILTLYGIMGLLLPALARVQVGMRIAAK